MNAERRSILRVALLMAAALVVDLGMWGWAWAARDELDAGFVIWGILLVALAGTSGVVAEFGLLRRRDLAEISPVAARRRPLPVIGVLAAELVLLVIATLAANSANDYPHSTGGAIRGMVIVIATTILGWPGAAALYGVRLAALELRVAEPGQAVETLRNLRDISRRLLEALGSLVSLTTLSLGASQLSQRSAEANTALALEVLVFGASGTALVGTLYLFPYSVLQNRARVLAREIAPLAGVAPEALSARLAEREALERALGVSTGITSELMSQVIVAGPVVAGAATLLISSR